MGDHFHGSNLSPKPIQIAFFLCEKDGFWPKVFATHLSFCSSSHSSGDHTLFPLFRIQTSQWLSVSDTYSNQTTLTSHSSSLLCLLTNCGFSFVCTICAGFEGSQMVVIGVILWDYVEGKHPSVLHSQAKETTRLHQQLCSTTFPQI